MFREMREALSIPPSIDILEHIRSLSNEPDTFSSTTSNDSPPSPTIGDLSSPSPTTTPSPAPTSPQSRAVLTIQAIERRAMASQRPQPGLVELMTYLSSHSIPKALCTRNFLAPVHHLLTTYLPDEKFDPIITRDTEGVAAKPSPEGIWRAAETWGLGGQVHGHNGSSSGVHTGDVDPLDLARRYLGSSLIMVGDSIDDLAAGYRAGAAVVLLANSENAHLRGHEYADVVVERLDELVGILDGGFEGKG
jgi:phosphoglycolate phosphatase-like HAD superfamily hydrolase